MEWRTSWKCKFFSVVSETYNIILYYVSLALDLSFKNPEFRPSIPHYLRFFERVEGGREENRKISYSTSTRSALRLNLLTTCSYTEILVVVTIFCKYKVSFFLFEAPYNHSLPHLASKSAESLVPQRPLYSLFVDWANSDLQNKLYPTFWLYIPVWMTTYLLHFYCTCLLHCGLQDSGHQSYVLSSDERRRPMYLFIRRQLRQLREHVSRLSPT